MTARKPTYKDLIAALGALLAEYAELDAMLDQFMATGEATEDERKRQRANNRAARRQLAVYARVLDGADARRRPESD